MRTTEARASHIERRALHLGHHLAIGWIPSRDTMAGPERRPQVTLRIDRHPVGPSDGFLNLDHHAAVGDVSGRRIVIEGNDAALKLLKEFLDK